MKTIISTISWILFLGGIIWTFIDFNYGGRMWPVSFVMIFSPILFVPFLYHVDDKDSFYLDTFMG